jgi:hypothetical protein
MVNKTLEETLFPVHHVMKVSALETATVPYGALTHLGVASRNCKKLEVGRQRVDLSPLPSPE